MGRFQFLNIFFSVLQWTSILLFVSLILLLYYCHLYIAFRVFVFAVLQPTWYCSMADCFRNILSKCSLFLEDSFDLVHFLPLFFVLLCISSNITDRKVEQLWKMCFSQIPDTTYLIVIWLTSICTEEDLLQRRHVKLANSFNGFDLIIWEKKKPQTRKSNMLDFLQNFRLLNRRLIKKVIQICSDSTFHSRMKGHEIWALFYLHWPLPVSMIFNT